MVQVENDEMHVDANFVNDREYEPNESNPNQNTNYLTGPLVGLAVEEKIGRRLFQDTVKAEQRVKFLQHGSIPERG